MKEMVLDRFSARLLGRNWILCYTFLVALYAGTKSSPFQEGTTAELTVVTFHLVLSVVTNEERVDEWHPCLYSEVRVSNLRQNTDEPCGLFAVFLRPYKNAGIIPPLFPEAFLPHHFQTIIHFPSIYSILYSRDIDFVVKWNKKRYILSDCVIILPNYSFSFQIQRQMEAQAVLWLSRYYRKTSGKINLRRNVIPVHAMKACGGVAVDIQAFLTLRRLMSYIYGAPILDVSRSHTTTQHSR